MQQSLHTMHAYVLVLAGIADWAMQPLLDVTIIMAFLYSMPSSQSCPVHGVLINLHKSARVIST